MSPRKSWSFSIVSGWIATTELSSLVASSTTSRFGDFFLSKIAVLKSLFVPLLHTHKNTFFFHKIPKKKIENLTNRKDLEKGYLRIGRFSFVSHDFAEIEEFWFVCVIFIREKKSAEVTANWENEELYKEEYRYFLLSKKSVFLFIFIL